MLEGSATQLILITIADPDFINTPDSIENKMNTENKMISTGSFSRPVVEMDYLSVELSSTVGTFLTPR